MIDPLKDEVRKRGLWACHLGPELGGRGFGQVKLSLMNEIISPSIWGPTIFGIQARTPATPRSSPTTGRRNRAQRYLEPLLRRRDLFSASR